MKHGLFKMFFSKDARESQPDYQIFTIILQENYIFKNVKN